jgi:hypothetical protein
MKLLHLQTSFYVKLVVRKITNYLIQKIDKKNGNQK